MRLDGERESENVEDQRSESRNRAPLVLGGLGTVVLVVVVALLGGNPQQVLNQLAQNQAAAPGAAPQNGGPGPALQEDDLKKFVSQVLADTDRKSTRLNSS